MTEESKAIRSVPPTDTTAKPDLPPAISGKQPSAFTVLRQSIESASGVQRHCDLESNRAQFRGFINKTASRTRPTLVARVMEKVR